MTSLRIPKSFAQGSFMEKHELPKIMLEFLKKFATESRLLMRMWFFIHSPILWGKFPLIGTLIFHHDVLEIGILSRNYSWNNSKLSSTQLGYINSLYQLEGIQLR